MESSRRFWHPATEELKTAEYLVPFAGTNRALVSFTMVGKRFQAVGAAVGAYACAPVAVLIGGYCLVVSITELSLALQEHTFFHGTSLFIAPILGFALGVSAGTRMGRYAAAASALAGVFVIATNFVPSVELGRGPFRYEAQAVGDTRILISAQTAFASFNGGFFAGDIECLSEPDDCFEGFPSGMPSFLGEGTTRLGVRQEYERTFYAGPSAQLPPDRTRTDGGPLSPASVTSYVYVAVRVTGYKKARNFCADSTGMVCYTENRAIPQVEAGRCVACELLD